MDHLFLLFKFIGGFGLFIYGMHTMADGLQKSAGDRMKYLISKFTNNRFFAVITGALVTAIIQSSSACTVMVVGFVNAGLLNLTQAVGVIMGANIGTTITSWIVSSSEWLVIFKPSQIAPLAVGIGALFIFFCRSEKKKELGQVIIGFGLLFIGIGFMKYAIAPFKDSPVFEEAFINLGKYPVLGILAGAVVTAIIQSSSASVGILQTVANHGLVPWNAAVYIILGQNIGTCVTAMLSSVGANKTAKRAAVIHLLFNVIGTGIFAIVSIVFFTFINRSMGDNTIDLLGISIFHTVFNVLNTVLLFNFAPALVKLSEKIVLGKDKVVVSEGEIALKHLDERILETPTFAIQNAIKEVVHMGDLAIENTIKAVKGMINRDLKLMNEVFATEKDINKLNERITEYLIKISNTSLTERQQLITTNLFCSINDIERIGDHAENVAKLVDYMHQNNITLSDNAIDELSEMADITIETLQKSIQSRKDDDVNAISSVESLEERVDGLEEILRDKHIRRLSQNACSPMAGIIFLDALSNLERMSDHALNIAEYVKDEIL